MTRSALVSWLVVLAQVAGAATPEADAGAEPVVAPSEAGVDAAEQELARQRMPFNVLVDRAIGATSRAVAYNWRASPVQFAATGSFLAELNTFNGARGGAMVRLPSARGVVEFGAGYARAWDSSSSRLLALTPYRQAGRPTRLELDATVGYALAEGVVTAAPRALPSLQLVFNAYGGVRYAVYPSGFKGLRPGQVGVALVSPALTEEELANLDVSRLDAMMVDPGRYWMTAGVGQDIYFKQGLFVSPRVMFTVPVLALASQSKLLLAPEFTLAVGISL